MKHLEAPWRSEYITSGSDPGDCVLCRIGADNSSDVENFVLHRTKSIYVVLNRFPYINGHMMIVPCRHVPDLASLGGDERDELMEMMVLSERALALGMDCMGMNGGWNLGSCAGAGIDGHVHIHMLPRWSGDTNFMTTVGETRVISASLEESYRRLSPYFGSEPDGS